MKITKQEVTQIAELLKEENGHSANHIRVEITKNILPHLFPETEIEVGKWYKWTGCNRAIGFISKPPFNDGGECYVFDYLTSGNTDIHSSLHHSNLTPATDQEVKEALIKEAKKRGFEEGVSYRSVKRMLHDGTETNVEIKNILSLNVVFHKSVNETSVLNTGSHAVFYNGNWATIIETITKEEAEKQLGKTII